MDFFIWYVLGSREDTSSKKVEVRPPEHLPFYHLDSVDLALELAVADRQGQASQHSGIVREESLSKPAQRSNPTGLRIRDPVVECSPQRSWTMARNVVLGSMPERSRDPSEPITQGT